jgi:hypothetical protein
VDNHDLGARADFFQAALHRLLPRRAADLQEPTAILQRWIRAQ